jgi:hypothetical protein
MEIKKWSLFRRCPLSNRYIQGVPEGDMPLPAWGFKGESADPLITKKGLDLWEVKNKVTCNQRWKVFHSISIRWEVAALWNQFWWKIQRKIVIFGNFEMSPRCHGNRKVQSEYAVTKAMVQSTCLLSLNIYSFIAIWTCNRRLFNENSHFSPNAHEVKD